MWVGIAIGIGAGRFAGSFSASYNNRVLQDGGVIESSATVDAASALLRRASLLLIPSGYKEAKVYAEIPSTGNGDLTWSRTSDAWRTYSDGTIRRTAWNLLQYSEQFNNGVWTQSAASVTADAIASPTNTNTADFIVENTANSSHQVFQAITGVIGANGYTASIYVKQNLTRNVTLRVQDNAFTYGSVLVTYDLSNGALLAQQTGVNGVIIFTTAQLINGYYRITLNFTIASSTSFRYDVLVTNGTSFSYTGNGTSGIYVWGAQLVEGSSSLPYFPTTTRQNVPRLSYMYGSCPALLLEPQRTNVLTYSNDFTNAIWVKDNSGATNPVVTANYATSPDGSNNASRLQLNKTGGVYSRIKQAVTTSGVYTFTVWMKSNTGASQNVGLRLEGTGINCVVTTSWQRFQVTTTVATNAESQILLYDLIPGNDETADILIYGAQTELGSFSTTYIPTTSATATRVADSFSRNNIYTNGLITSSGGTWFVELRNNIAYTRDSASGLEIANSGFTQRIIIFNAGGNSRLIVFLTTAGVVYTTTTDTVKIAIKWNGSTASVFANGTKVANNVTFTGLNMENLIGGQGVPFFIQQMALFSTPLSDSQCTALTTINGYPTATEALSSISITPESSTCMNNTINTLVS